MKIKIKDSVIDLEEQPLDEGGEGEIYLLNYLGEKKCVKIYFPEKRTAYIERKVIALINRFNSIQIEDIDKYVAFPEEPVYDVVTGKFCGFTMKAFLNHTKLSELSFDLLRDSYGSSDLKDNNAVQIAEKLYFLLKVFHKIGLIVGDINPENILIHNFDYNPVLVDIDSFQVGTYYSNSKRRDYFDPKVRIDGYGKAKYFIYSTNSDIFSLSIIVYEFMIGCNPYYFQTVPPSETNYKKQIGLSFLDFFTDNNEKISQESIDLLKNDLSNLLSERLSLIRLNYFEIFAFLKSVLSENKRYYFYYQTKKEVKVKRKNGIINLSTIELIIEPKEDPIELGLFLEQYKLTIPQ